MVWALKGGHRQASLAQDLGQWRALVKIAIKLQVHKMQKI